MAAINFNEGDIHINNSGILAESASIDYSNSLKPNYTIGFRNSMNQDMDGPITNRIQLDYIPELAAEPNFQIINSIKGITGNPFLYSGINISIAGVTGRNCYLENFSLKMSPNNIVKASASYSSFVVATGVISKKYENISYNTTNSISNGGLVFVMSSGNFATIPTYSLEYNFGASWEPIYKIGQNEPVQVNFNGGFERFNIIRDGWYQFGFTGEKSQNRFLTISSNDYYIDITTIGIISNSSHTDLKLDVSGCYIKNHVLNVGVDDIIKTNTTIDKYF